MTSTELLFDRWQEYSDFDVNLYEVEEYFPTLDITESVIEIDVYLTDGFVTDTRVSISLRDLLTDSVISDRVHTLLKEKQTNALHSY